MFKEEADQIAKMIAVLVSMATLMLLLILAYRAGYIDAKEKEHIQLKDEISQLEEKVAAYRVYYFHTEKFIEKLDSNYGWINELNPQEYYESRHIVDTLEGTSNLEYN